MNIRMLFQICTTAIFLVSDIYANQENCRQIFSNIYEKRIWGVGSGPGSDMTQTKTIREALPQILQVYNVETFLDAPCGDFFWMKTIDLPVKHYIGVDVVNSIIQKNKELYENEFYTFIQLDLTREIVPKADLVLCRDCLVHLSYREIKETINLLKKSGATYLLTTSFSELLSNSDISTGDWRPINLMLEPFNFPAPLLIIYENCTSANGYWSDKSLMLWRLTDIEEFKM